MAAREVLKSFKSPNTKHLGWFVKVALAVFIAGLIAQFPFYYIESLFYDARVRVRPVPAVSGNVAIVSIDRSTYTMMGHPDVKGHQALIQSIQEDQPRAIVYTFSPNDIPGSLEDRILWAKSMEQRRDFYVAVDDIIIRGEEQRLSLPFPYQSLNSVSAPLTSDSNNFAGDAVTRRLIISYDDRLLLHAQLAQMYNGLLRDSDYRGHFEFKGATQNYVNFRPKGTYKPLVFQNVMEKRFPRGTFTNKIVLIGRDTGVDANDYIRTPYSRDPEGMSKLELHANMIDTLILNNSPLKTPRGVDIFLASIIAIITMIAVWSLKPTQGLVTLIAAFTTSSFLAYVLFAGFNVWIGITPAILSIFICYYFFIPYRLIMENRRSWEYYQKNKLLTQVEELKNNFLSLMSHDLKTPLARIQGMADMALRDKHPLSGPQQEALKTINKSSEELSYFISSILNLTRVESQEVKLHLHSKDINALLEEVISKYEFMALEKNIQIIREFEPIFSLKLDVDLMRQVFTNLIENAIKYSPENSKVLVTTEEVNGNVFVQIADQGIGIPVNEMGNIFMKFYRSHEAKNSPIKGSGLGLYLAKYFVDLHKGNISVESVPREGSTFTVQLPMEQ